MAGRPVRGLIRALLAAALACAGALTACSATDPPMPSSATRSPATPSGPTPSNVTPSNVTPSGADPAPATSEAGTPDTVAVAATAAWLSYDTRVDQRPNDTARRLALPWLASAMRHQVLTFAGTADPGEEWAQWTGHRAHATVEARLGGDDHPPDTADAAWRQVIATITLRGDDGWTATVRRTVFVQLGFVQDADAPGRWLVGDLQTTQE